MLTAFNIAASMLGGATVIATAGQDFIDNHYGEGGAEPQEKEFDI